MKIAVIIPSRYGSTRFEGKPLALIDGKPMIEWVYRQARKAGHVTDVAVATDDPRISEAVERFGGRAILTSSEARSGTDRVGEAAEIMALAPEDIVVNVQGDQPLIDYRCLDDVIRPLVSEPGIEMSTLAYKIVDEQEITNPKDVKVTFDRKGFALYFSRAPIPFPRDPEPRFDTYKHLGVYAYSRRFLDIFRNLAPGTLEGIEKLEQLRAMEHGYRIRVVVTPYDSPEVDLPEDIPRIETLLRKQGGADPPL
jgi:3-deoxy-manno-octulosonate cytidylyltransferase (CMP-KDO synthetase)